MLTTRLRVPGLCLLLAACGHDSSTPASSPAPATATIQPAAMASAPASSAALRREDARPAAGASSATVDPDAEKARAEKEASEGPEFEELTRQTEQEWCAAPPKERCDALRAFRRAGVPKVAASASFTVGSEAGRSNPAEFLVMRFAPSSQPGTGVQVATTDLKADNAAEIAQTQRYIASLARGQRDVKSPLQGFLQTPHSSEGFFKAREALGGWVLRNDGPRPFPGTTVLRQDGRSLYLFRLAIAGGGSHLQLAVFPAP